MRIIENLFKTITLVIAIVAIVGMAIEPFGLAYFLWAIIMGGLTWIIATKYRGRKGYWPFIYGWVYGIFAMIYYAVAGSK